MIKNSMAVRQDMETRINRLTQLAKQRRALLGATLEGTEHKTHISNTSLPTGDREKIQREIEAIEAEREELIVSLAELQKTAPPPANKAQLQELARATEEAKRAYEKFISALNDADAAGRAFQKLRRRQATLYTEQKGLPDNWKSSKEGAMTGEILQVLAHLFSDLQLTGIGRNKK